MGNIDYSLPIPSASPAFHVPPVVRIFLGMSALAVLLLVANLGLGLATGDYNGAFAQAERASAPLREARAKLLRQSPLPAEEVRRIDQELSAAYAPLQPTKAWVEAHVLLGIAAALVTVLVNSISVTYFIGTARWVREVVETFQLPPDVSLRCDALKASTFPWSAGGIVAVLVLAGLGAASHPGARFTTDANYWVLWHHIAAWLVVTLVAISFYMQGECIAANNGLIDEVLDEVEHIRRERGLPLEDEEDELDDEVESESKEIESGQGG